MASLAKLLKSTVQHPLNARDMRSKLSAISRVARWQLASRLMPEADFILPFVGDSRLVVSRGMVGATGNWYSGLDEADEMAFLLHARRLGDLFLDIGANVGSYTILASTIPGVTGLAFEPVPETFEKLQRNLVLNTVSDRFEGRQMGVGARSERLRFTIGLDSMNFVSDDAGAEIETVEVPVVRLDDVVPRDIPGRLVAKIDVEGFEMAVLEGGVETLGSPNFLAVIMETNGSGERYGSSDVQLFRRMAELGFDPFWYNALDRSLVAAEPNQRSRINTLFLKDVDEVSNRVREAARSVLVNGTI